MDDFVMLISGAVQVTLLDIVLSGDNIGVIALATKDLPRNLARRASMLGVAGAVLLRILFACLLTYILMISWLPIKLVGGILLFKITWDFIKDNSSEDENGVRAASKFWPAVSSIIIADITMSLDNVLAIAGAAHGHVSLIIFGLILNIPIIFFGSQFVANLMRKYPIVIFIGGAVLAHTAFKMFFEDNLIKPYLPEIITTVVPYIMAFIVIIYGTSKQLKK
ncbi:MAG: TerC family protein [Bacillota bacterium]|nr:TerC family protein [Bacillota bacterium]